LASGTFIQTSDPPNRSVFNISSTHPCDLNYNCAHVIPIHPGLSKTRQVIHLDQRVNFQHGFEALYLKAYRNQISAQMTQELLKLGLDLQNLKTAYPHSVFLDSMKVLAKHVYPKDQIEVAFAKIGERLAESYFETVIGKPLLVLLRLLGPKRVLYRTKRNFRSANNYSDSDLVELGPKEFQLWLNEVGPLAFSTLGILQRGMVLTGANEIRVQILSTDSVGTIFHLSL
jgi:uncharacterized protein (TIGR02265 family)